MMNAFLLGCNVGLLIMIVRLETQVQKLKKEVYSFDNKYYKKTKQLFYIIKDYMTSEGK